MNDGYRPRAEPLARNLTRRQRAAARRGNAKPGGLTVRCGCRYTRTGGTWIHLTPCRNHRLQQRPLTDEHMKELAA